MSLLFCVHLYVCSTFNINRFLWRVPFFASIAFPSGTLLHFRPGCLPSTQLSCPPMPLGPLGFHQKWKTQTPLTQPPTLYIRSSRTALQQLFVLQGLHPYRGRMYVFILFLMFEISHEIHLSLWGGKMKSIVYRFSLSSSKAIFHSSSSVPQLDRASGLTFPYISVMSSYLHLFNINGRTKEDREINSEKLCRQPQPLRSR